MARDPRLVTGRSIPALAAVLFTAALIALLPPAAVAASQPVQVVDGSIALPLRFAADPTYSSWPGGQRQIYSIAGSNGHVGYTIELSEEVGGGAFDLAVLSGLTGLEDLDIAFYASFNPVVSTSTIGRRALGGEVGVIPEGSRFAVITMFDGANAQFRFQAFAPEPTGGGPGPRNLPPLPESPGIYPDFGHDGPHTQHWAARLKRRSHVVIAVIDTGINPYHLAYRRPEYAVHPSHYIDGFPADAPALGLTFGDDYVTARGTDDPSVWSQVQERQFYWIPGTNIIGAYSVGDLTGSSARRPRLASDH